MISPTVMLYNKWKRNILRLGDNNIRGKSGSVKMEEDKKEMIKL